MDGANPAIGGSHSSACQLIVNVAGPDHGPLATIVIEAELIQPPLEAALAASQLASYVLVHSKLLLAFEPLGRSLPTNGRKRRRVSGFFLRQRKSPFRVRWFKV